MLPRQITRLRRTDQLNSFTYTLLQALCRSEKTHPLCYQADPNSFGKTPGVGVAGTVHLAIVSKGSRGPGENNPAELLDTQNRES
jgi:hypothetical protein